MRNFFAKMNVCFAADYGVGAGEYTPTETAFGITKIAKQIVEGETITGKYSSLFKEEFKTGKELEATVIKAAKGTDRSATVAPAANLPETEILLFKGSTARTYGVLIDDKDIYAASKDEAAARDIAEQTVRSLYAGAFDEENKNVVEIFTGANDGEGQIIKYGTQLSMEFTDEQGAQNALYLVQKIAKLVREGDPTVNPKSLTVRASRVVMLAPSDFIARVNAYGKINAQNLDFTGYGVDEVLEYVNGGNAGDVYIFDDRYAQIAKVRPDSYKEAPQAGTDNVKAYLHRYVQYAGCPLFNCVKIEKKAEA